MNCPECKDGILSVVETFPDNLAKYRHYRCRACEEDVVTREDVSTISLLDLRRVKSAKRRGDKEARYQFDDLVGKDKEKAMSIARKHAGNPFGGLFK